MAPKTLKDIRISLHDLDPIDRVFEINDADHPIYDFLKRKSEKKLNLNPGSIKKVKILKRSLDARGNRQPQYIFTLSLETTLDESPAVDLPEVKATAQRWEHPPIIVGSGPAGLFAAWTLARSGAKPLILERGPHVKKRSQRWFGFLKGEAFDSEANLLFGEGGAGAYSDGKLTTRIKDPRVKEVLDIFVECGAPLDTRFDAKPHIGSNYLPAIVRRMRKQIIAWGGQFHFECCLKDLIFSKTKLKAILTTTGEIPASILILAIGHSARDTYRKLHLEGLAMQAKPFQMGVRVEHPQEIINKNQFGRFFGDKNLPVAEYNMVAKNVCDKLDLFSFCMCPGGEILPASEKSGFLCVNGASKRARSSPFANSGLVITIDPKHFDNDPIKGIAFQEHYERLAFEKAGGQFAAPGQKISDFLKKKESKSLLKTSYPLSVHSCDFNHLLPPLLTQALHIGLPRLESKIKGFTGEDGMMVGPEARSCSPIRLQRNPKTLESINRPGIFPIGEGAGYAGGIMSAAVDGLRVAEVLLVA